MSSGLLTVALVGDHAPDVTAHRAIPVALSLAAERLGVRAAPRWVPTDSIADDDAVAGADAVWCVPASPYRSEAGSLRAIRVARERGIPFLGTCGGFQHAVLEYARHVLGWHDAGHAETAPDAARAVIAPLACALVEETGLVRFVPGSRLAAAYGAAYGAAHGAPESVEGYHCRYGLNPAMAAALTAGPLRATATDAGGEVRAVELDGHPFFVATLFQPERAALAGRVPPPATALLAGAVAAGAGGGAGNG
jgi:CTP synthase (UTP-ammonia lyase)